MNLVDTIMLASRSLLLQRMRTLLAMTGLTIGITAIILLVALGNGARTFILREFQSLGSNLIIVQPGKSDRKGHMGPPVGAAQRKMTIQDVHAIERYSYNIEAVTGLIYGTTTLRYEDVISNVNVFGCNEQFIQVLSLNIMQGNFFSREEDESGRRVIVLGNSVAQNLFPDGDAIGKRVKVFESEFKVIGIVATTGSSVGFNLDEFVFIPTRAALRIFNDDKLFGIRAKARSKIVVDDAVEELRTILTERRGGEEDFTIVTQAAMMESLETILSMLTYVLGGIAAISMLVAGVGIMNIMLVTVSERTHEIGVRRAVGARRRDIIQQFLVEAIVLCCVGGLLGVIIPSALCMIAYLLYPSFDLRPPWWIIWTALGSAVSIGVIFGVWPARKAANIETLDALRYE